MNWNLSERVFREAFSEIFSHAKMPKISEKIQGGVRETEMIQKQQFNENSKILMRRTARSFYCVCVIYGRKFEWTSILWNV